MEKTPKERIIEKLEKLRDHNAAIKDWGGETAEACYSDAIAIVKEEMS